MRRINHHAAGTGLTRTAPAARRPRMSAIPARSRHGQASGSGYTGFAASVFLPFRDWS